MAAAKKPLKRTSRDPKTKKGQARGKQELSLEIIKGILLTHMEPLEFLLRVMVNESVPLFLRVQCATAAAPYVHKRMPAAIEVSGDVNHTHRGGVMVVTEIPAAKDWQKQSIRAQTKLKDEVKH